MNTSRKILLFVIILLGLTLIWSNPLQAQGGENETLPIAGASDLKFEHLSLEDGLSSVWVKKIIQDSPGFIWLATSDGLNRYDGYEFKVYRHDPDNPGSLNDNNTNTVYIDRAGVLWVGTFNGGLNKVDRATERFTRYAYDPNDPTSLSGHEVWRIAEDGQGNFWALSIETAIPCGLIINELVSNAFKHAFPNGRSGEIWIELQKFKNQQLALTVRDNGIGFPPELDFQRSHSLGLTLVNILVKQINGEIEVMSENGTAFTIIFCDTRR